MYIHVGNSLFAFHLATSIGFICLVNVVITCSSNELVIIVSNYIPNISYPVQRLLKKQV
jgi:hypothetical protein